MSFRSSLWRQLWQQVQPQPKFAIVIVDPQNDFGTQAGSLYVPKGEEIVPEINELRTSLFLGVKDTVITKDWHPADHVSFFSNHADVEAAPFTKITLPDGTQQDMWPPHCVQDSDGSAIITGLYQSPNDFIVHKGCLQGVDSYSGFGSADGVSEVTPLHSELQARGITHLIVCGLAFEYCVAATAKDAAKLGYKTFVMLSGTRGISAEGCAAQKALMVAAGVGMLEGISEVVSLVKLVLN